MVGLFVLLYVYVPGVLDCLAKKKRLPEDEYEVRGVGMLLSGGPERGRLNKLHQVLHCLLLIVFFFNIVLIPKQHSFPKKYM